MRGSVAEATQRFRDFADRDIFKYVTENDFKVVAAPNCGGMNPNVESDLNITTNDIEDFLRSIDLKLEGELAAWTVKVCSHLSAARRAALHTAIGRIYVLLTPPS